MVSHYSDHSHHKWHWDTNLWRPKLTWWRHSSGSDWHICQVIKFLTLLAWQIMLETYRCFIVTCYNFCIRLLFLVVELPVKWKVNPRHVYEAHVLDYTCMRHLCKCLIAGVLKAQVICIAIVQSWQWLKNLLTTAQLLEHDIYLYKTHTKNSKYTT